MSFLKILKPNFWDHEDIAAGPYKHLFNFRRIWKLTVCLTAGVTLIPMAALTLIDHIVTLKTIESENVRQMVRLVSNTSTTVTFFIEEQRSALDFLVRDNTPGALANSNRLASILEHLKKGFDGFVELEMIDSQGNRKAYAGPYKRTAKNCLNERWFREVLLHGRSISGVMSNPHQSPYINFAVKHPLTNGTYYVLRASFEIGRMNDLLSMYDKSGLGDAFMINHEGILQTSSSRYGKVLERFPLSLQALTEKTNVTEIPIPDDETVIIGSAQLSQTPFILMIVKGKEEVLGPWRKIRTDLFWLLLVSTVVILAVIVGMATYLVQKIHVADQRRIMTLHQVEYQNKLASIGRLAAGAAHEINNPLAIINEKAGLIKDMFTLGHFGTQDPKLLSLLDSIRSSVERCGRITKSLLNFVRHIEVKFQSIDLGKIITNVTTLLGRDAENKSILFSVDINDDVPEIESDQSHLQQIFLNLVNNVFGALREGGRLSITVAREGTGSVSITFKDDRPPIPDPDLNRIFDPFFSTKGRKVGTGLGLPITYGLVQEIGGTLTVTSDAEKGTCFTIKLPIKMDKETLKEDAGNLI